MSCCVVQRGHGPAQSDLPCAAPWGRWNNGVSAVAHACTIVPLDPTLALLSSYRARLCACLPLRPCAAVLCCASQRRLPSDGLPLVTTGGHKLDSQQRGCRQQHRGAADAGWMPSVLKRASLPMRRPPAKFSPALRKREEPTKPGHSGSEGMQVNHSLVPPHQPFSLSPEFTPSTSERGMVSTAGPRGSGHNGPLQTKAETNQRGSRSGRPSYT